MFLRNYKSLQKMCFFSFYTFEGEGKFAGMVIVDSFLDNEDDEKTLADNATLGANCCKKVNKQLTGSKQTAVRK